MNHIFHVLSFSYCSDTCYVFCLCSTSIVFVVKTNASPNTDEEIIREKIYRAIWATFFVVAVPVISYALWGPGQFFDEVGGDLMAGVIFVVCLSLFTLWSILCFVRIFCSYLRNEGAENAKAYAKQMMWYNVVFILLVFPEVVYASVAYLQSPNHEASRNGTGTGADNSNGSTDTIHIHMSLQLTLFLQQYVPLANAIIWGLSKTCAVKCLGLWCFCDR